MGQSILGFMKTNAGPIDIGSSLFGGLMKAGGQFTGGMDAQKQAAFEASVLQNNAYIANEAAAAALEKGRIAEQESQVSTAQTIGAQRAGFAAHGVVVDQDTALDVSRDTARVGKLDQMTIRRNAEREALAYKMQGINFNLQAKATKAAGQSAMFSGFASGLGTLLTTGGKVAAKWATYANKNNPSHAEVLGY